MWLGPREPPLGLARIGIPSPYPLQRSWQLTHGIFLLFRIQDVAWSQLVDATVRVIVATDSCHASPRSSGQEPPSLGPALSRVSRVITGRVTLLGWRGLDRQVDSGRRSDTAGVH